MTDSKALVASAKTAADIIDRHPSEVDGGALLYRDLANAIERLLEAAAGIFDSDGLPLPSGFGRRNEKYLELYQTLIAFGVLTND